MQESSPWVPWPRWVFTYLDLWSWALGIRRETVVSHHLYIPQVKCFTQKVALTPFVPSPKESWAEYAGASSCDRSWSYHMQHVSHLAAGFQHPDCTLTMLTLGCAHVGPADGLTRQSPRTEQSQPLQNQPAQPSGQAGARPSHQQPASAQLSNALSLGPS